MRGCRGDRIEPLPLTDLADHGVYLKSLEDKKRGAQIRRASRTCLELWKQVILGYISSTLEELGIVGLGLRRDLHNSRRATHC